MHTMSDLSRPPQKTQGIITFIACKSWIREPALGLRNAWNNNAKRLRCMMSVLLHIGLCGLPVSFSGVWY